MILKELLNNCDFKDIAPFIAQNYPEEAGGMPHIKIAFDRVGKDTRIFQPVLASLGKYTIWLWDF
jgi:hypothetical protein